MLRRPVILAAGGVALLAVAWMVGVWQQRTHTERLRDVLALQVLLDSTRAALGRATTAADSVRLNQEVQSREWYLGRRAYHLAGGPPPSPWRPRGLRAVLAVCGAALLLGGAALALRRSAAPA